MGDAKTMLEFQSRSPNLKLNLNQNQNQNQNPNLNLSPNLNRCLFVMEPPMLPSGERSLLPRSMDLSMHSLLDLETRQANGTQKKACLNGSCTKCQKLGPSAGSPISQGWIILLEMRT